MKRGTISPHSGRLARSLDGELEVNFPPLPLEPLPATAAGRPPDRVPLVGGLAKDGDAVDVALPGLEDHEGLLAPLAGLDQPSKLRKFVVIWFRN